MLRLLRLLVDLFTRLFRSRRDLLLENLALRQQLGVFKQKHPPPRFATTDKLFWVMLSRLWVGWRRALIVVQRRQLFAGIGRSSSCIGRGFRDNRTRTGRKCVSRELRA